MASSFLFHEDYLLDLARCTPKNILTPGADVWQDQPTYKGTILYSVVTPIICTFGIFGNSLSLMVLRRRELIGSVYTYLAVLAMMDLLMSIILLFGGLSRGALYYKRGWATYDALIGLPLCGVINSMNIMATVAVTTDRVLFLWNPVQCTKPKFCNQKVARRLMAVGFFISILLNIPYCFIFKFDDMGNLTTTPFFDSRLYSGFNWFMLIAFSILPAFILIMGNGFLIMSLQKARQIGLRCKGRRRDHTNLTVTLISIIVLFLVSEIPSSLVSRTKAIAILFNGDHTKANSRVLEIIRQICTLLGAINITTNFLFYYLFCPAFCSALFKVVKKNESRKSVQVNVFVLNGNCKKKTNLRTKIMEIRGKSLDSYYRSTLFNSNNHSVPMSASDKNSESKRQIEGEYVEILEESDVGEYSSGSTVTKESFDKICDSNNSNSDSKSTYQYLF